jgi:hypothetical protein
LNFLTLLESNRQNPVCKNANENANEKAAQHSAGRLGLSLPLAFLDVLFGFNAGVLLLRFGIPSRARLTGSHMP